MMRRAPLRSILWLAGAVAIAPGPALAAPRAAAVPLSTRDSFRLGDAGVLCTAQTRPSDPRLKGMFERGYLITCRDAAGPVGSALALRTPRDLATLPSALPSAALTCAAATSVPIAAAGPAHVIKCHDATNKLDYLRYAATRGRTHYIVEGLAGYDPALRLALASLMLDRPQTGIVEVATTEVSDPAAFARTQAGSLDLAGTRAEAYARSNGARFAESAEFFENLASRDKDQGGALAEALANQGLQQSNLGNFGAATRLLARAEQAAPAGDGVSQRLLRNYHAIDALNQRDPDAALIDLAKPVAAVAEDEAADDIRAGLIKLPLALLINRESRTAQELAQLGAGLTASERAAVLDAQAMELRGIALRQQGKLAAAETALGSAAQTLAKVRDGRVSSTQWLRSEIDVERALVAEAQGNRAAAAAAFDRAIATLALAFPDSPALLSARARKAAFLLRGGDRGGARALFDGVVKDSARVADSSGALRGLLGPYFELLATSGSSDDAAAMFRAAQIMQRPGVAQTQAILARQMSEGNDEASALFRLAVARARDILRADAEVSRLTALTAPTPRDAAALKLATAARDSLRSEQTRLSARLADYPRYKALAPAQVDLADLRAALRRGEGYYKMMVVDDRVYALYATSAGARAARLDIGAAALGQTVAALRDSIARTDAKGQLVTAPFDLVRARALYVALFGALDGELGRLQHLVFEPDGAMLQLPPYVLVTRQAGIDAYRARLAKGGDAFDFRGIDWLGRGRQVSISVSPRSFLDMRAMAPSHARHTYLGIGDNQVALARPALAVADDCDWPIQTWQDPISPDELLLGQAVFGAGTSRLVTGAAFTDTALLADPALADYKILHFATHGLVTAPRPDCPARPALVTSFAAAGSDGLLSFREVFDLKLDADVVILSACDTAGAASTSASREAGITGGNYALDGLVRAFVGAGARSVVASHWPVPDTYDATKRLISGMLRAAPGEPLAKALGEAQRALMDDPRTSHPFYWAAFIILGDGAKPLVGSAAPRMAARPGASASR